MWFTRHMSNQTIADIATRAADNGRTVEQQAALERFLGTSETVTEQRLAGITEAGR